LDKGQRAPFLASIFGTNCFDSNFAAGQAAAGQAAAGQAAALAGFKVPVAAGEPRGGGVR
jgi:hypothetical protein